MNADQIKEFENKATELYRLISGDYVMAVSLKRHDCNNIITIGHKKNIRQKIKNRKKGKYGIALLPPGKTCARCNGTGVEPIVI